MATKRIKQLSTIAPTAAKWLAHEGDTGGTGKASVEDVVTIGAEAIGLVGDRTVGRDDFTEGSGAWYINTPSAGGGRAKVSASGTPFGMPSRGILLLKATTTSGSIAEVIRTKTGLVLGASSTIVLTWRYFLADRPADSSVFTVILGAISATPSTAVAVQLSIDNTTVTANLDTQTGGAPAQESFTFPAGTWFDIRLTISETGTTVDIAPDGGAFATALVGTNAPTQAIYAPWAKVNRETSNGSGQIALDFVDWDASRTAEDPGVPVVDDSEDFARPPSLHASTHVTGGTDVIASAVSSGSAGLMTGADKAKLDGIEAGAINALAGTGLTKSGSTLAADFGTASGKVCQGNDSRLSDSRAPNGSAGGDLAGTYPNPTIAANAVTAAKIANTTITAAQIANATITDTQVAAANKDGAVGTASMRTLGSGPTQAAPGDAVDWYGLTVASEPPEDFLANQGVTQTNWQQSVTGTGATTSGLGTEAGHPGVCVLSTGTTNTGRATIYRGAATSFRVGTDGYEIQCIVKIPTLATSGEDFDLFIGASAVLGVEPPDGIYFRAPSIASGLNANWYACGSSGSVFTRTDTAIALSTNYVRLRIVLNAAGTSCDFYINGTLATTVSLHLPGATAMWDCMAILLKNNGTTSRDARIDRIGQRFLLASSR